jgi:uncharacterized protein YcbX
VTAATVVKEIWRYPVKSMAGERLERSEVGERGLWGDRGWAVRNDDTGEIHNAKRFPVLMQCSARYRTPPGEDQIPEVDITLPDGEALGTDSARLSTRLSELMGRPVSLRRLEPATNRKYYRRDQPGAALIGRLAASRTLRRLIQRVVEGQLRLEFGREPDEPMPDLGNMTSDVFEFYTPPGTYFDVLPIHVISTSAMQTMRMIDLAASWDVRRFRPNVLIETATDQGHVERNWVGHTVQIGGFAIRGEMPTIRCAMTMHAQNELPRDPLVLRAIVRDADQCLGLYASVVVTGTVSVGDPVTLGRRSSLAHNAFDK